MKRLRQEETDVLREALGEYVDRIRTDVDEERRQNDVIVLPVPSGAEARIRAAERLLSDVEDRKLVRDDPLETGRRHGW